MTLLTLALVVGVLFATGTYLILQRRAIRLILGLGLLTHGVNLLLFSSGGLGRGLPPIILDKKAFAGDITPFVDPLPQALILTAIVISFAVTAFTVVLVNRRHTLAQSIGPDSSELPSIKAPDPFASAEHYGSGLDAVPDDYEYLEFSLADELRRRRQLAQEKVGKDAAATTAKGAVEGAALAGSETSAETRITSDETSQDGDLLSSEAFVSEGSADGSSGSERSGSERSASDASHQEGSAHDAPENGSDSSSKSGDDAKGEST